MRFQNTPALSGVIIALQKEINMNRKFIKWFAAEKGYSRHMLYRIAYLNNLLILALSKLFPFWHVTRNYDVLKFMAKHCRYVKFKILNGSRLETMAEIPKSFDDIVSSLIKYWNKDITPSEIKAIIDDSTGTLTSARSAYEKNEKKQENQLSEVEDD